MSGVSEILVYANYASTRGIATKLARLCRASVVFLQQRNSDYSRRRSFIGRFCDRKIAGLQSS